MYYSGIDRHKRDSVITTYDTEGRLQNAVGYYAV